MMFKNKRIQIYMSLLVLLGNNQTASYYRLKNMNLPWKSWV
jgi:hypothetical protein